MRRAIFPGWIFVSLLTLGDLTTVFAHQQATGDHVWQSYTNVRFNYKICYPEDLLVPQGESPNSDGQEFLAKDGAQLLVFGGNNILGQSLKDAMAGTASRLAGASGKITYKMLRPNTFTISGSTGQTIFYAKTLYSGDQFKSFELTYRRSAAVVYDPVISRLATCFADLAR